MEETFQGNSEHNRDLNKELWASEKVAPGPHGEDLLAEVTTGLDLNV